MDFVKKGIRVVVAGARPRCAGLGLGLHRAVGFGGGASLRHVWREGDREVPLYSVAGCEKGGGPNRAGLLFCA